MKLDEITGGSPYGASTIAAGDGSRQPSEKRARGRTLSRTRDRETAKKTAWLMPRGRHSPQRAPPPFTVSATGREFKVLRPVALEIVGSACSGRSSAFWNDGLRHDRISLYLSIGAQSTAGDDAALVVPQPQPRLKRQASMPRMHPFVTLFVLIGPDR